MMEQRSAYDLKDRLGAFDYARFVPMSIDLIVEGRGIPTAGPESRRKTLKCADLCVAALGLTSRHTAAPAVTRL